MLSDLVQYFTKTDISMLVGMDDSDMAKFLLFVYKYTFNDDFKEGIMNDVITNQEGFYEAFEVFASVALDGDMHFQDALPSIKSYDNLFFEMIFSTFLKSNQYIFQYGNYSASMMLDEDPEHDCDFAINTFSGVDSDYKINGFIDRFILNEMNDCGKDGYIDEYTADMLRFVFGYLKITDKSFARKIRKLYKKHACVKKLFSELNMFMHNGCFIFCFAYDVEGYSYNGGELMDVFSIIENLKNLREKLGFSNFNQPTRALSIAFQKLNYMLLEDEYLNNHYDSFISMLIANLSKKIDPPKNEVIL